MVSTRCLTIVKNVLEKLGYQDFDVKLGEISLQENLTHVHLLQIGQALQLSGLELMQDRKSILVERIKGLIIEVVYHSEEPLVVNLSIFLSDQLHREYTYMANLFSERLGTTIEKFYICHKIERVKELLSSGGLSLTDIAFKLNYRSVSHLSTQFKKVVGITPSEFKERNDHECDLPDNLCR